MLFLGSIAHAEQLPIKTYTTADGLAQDCVNRIIRDSRGFLWFCTREGLSRFDGYRFTSYTTDQGLPNRWVNYLLEARDGSYWVAAGNCVCRFNLTGAPLFIPYTVPAGQLFAEVHVLLEDPAGALEAHRAECLYQALARSAITYLSVGCPSALLPYHDVRLELREDGSWQVGPAKPADAPAP